ncbi:SAM-dependent methyltransferase [Minicystis rosea]|nr:SAM-dependent methyltransferase [Minicystis rosea]
MEPHEARIPYRRCPLCEAESFVEEKIGDCRHHPLYKPEIPPQIRWMRCLSCAHVFVDGYLSDPALSAIFASVMPNQRPGWDLYGSRAVSARMVEKVTAVIGEGRGRWLDVGFGNGALLATAGEYGFDPVGLDMRKENVELMNRYGIEAHALELTDFNPAEKMTVISMADVLEHIPFPKTALTHARQIIAGDGLLFVSMPNADSFVWKRLDEMGQNPYWGELEHLHNFGRKRLYALLEEHGFRAVKYGISERYYMCMEVLARPIPR